jgi:pyruvate,orthophosphate dikinase
VIDQAEAVLRVDPSALDQLLHPTLDPDAERPVIAKGLPASPGAACGKVVFDADTAEEWAKREDGSSWCASRRPPRTFTACTRRRASSPPGRHDQPRGRGRRGMGRPCVSGAGSLAIDYRGRCFRVGVTQVSEGDLITIDGTTGEVMLGEVPTIQPELSATSAC